MGARRPRGSGLTEAIPGSANNVQCDFEQVVSVPCALVSLPEMRRILPSRALIRFMH